MEADSVDRMVCYEIALQPRPQDDADFYLAAVRSSLLLPQSQSTHPPSAAGLSRSLSYGSFRLHRMSHFACCQRKHTKLLSCMTVLNPLLLSCAAVEAWWRREGRSAASERGFQRKWISLRLLDSIISNKKSLGR